jgi:hypothetical protein
VKALKLEHAKQFLPFIIDCVWVTIMYPHLYITCRNISVRKELMEMHNLGLNIKCCFGRDIYFQHIKVCMAV